VSEPPAAEMDFRASTPGCLSCVDRPPRRIRLRAGAWLAGACGRVTEGLHVVWTNVTKSCDKIELSRKHDAGEYAVADTLVGAADSQHDGNATAPGVYCYKARCLKGEQTSPDSNEKCGAP